MKVCEMSSAKMGWKQPLIVTGYIIIIVAIILSNMAVILSISCIRRLRTTMYFFLLSLSIADISVGVVVMPLRLSEIFGAKFTSSVNYCRVSHCFTLLSISASVLNLVVIAIDKYIAINHPYRYLHWKERPCFYLGSLFTLCWLAAFVIAFLPLMGWGTNGRSGPRTSVGICKFNETLDSRFVLVYVNIVFFLPLILISFLYVKVFITARKMIRQIHSMERISSDPHAESSVVTTAKKNAKHVASNWKTAKTMVIVFAVFISTMLAFTVSVSIFFMCKQCANAAVIIITHVIMFSGNAVNPFIYFIRLPAFRSEMKRYWSHLRSG